MKFRLPYNPQERLNQILNDKGHSYWDSTAADHDQAVEEVGRLMAAVHGEGIIEDGWPKTVDSKKLKF